MVKKVPAHPLLKPHKIEVKPGLQPPHSIVTTQAKPQKKDNTKIKAFVYTRLPKRYGVSCRNSYQERKRQKGLR